MASRSDNRRAIQTVPDGYHSVTPWIVSRDTAALLAFVQRAFSAEELARIHNDDGTIGHAEFRIGDAVIMAFDAKVGWPDTPSFLRLFVEDGDETYKRALESGATSVTEMTDMFFGDRIGRVRDPLGNIWWIQMRHENVSPQEMAERAGEQKYMTAMRHVQESLDQQLSQRGRPL